MRNFVSVTRDSIRGTSRKFSVSASINFRKNRDRSNRTGLSKLDFLIIHKNNEFLYVKKQWIPV